MAQEVGWAGSLGVRTGLKDDEEIPDFGHRKANPVGEHVQRRAQTPDGGHLLLRLPPDTIANRDRVVPSDDLPEVAGRGELVMKATVGNEKHSAT